MKKVKFLIVLRFYRPYKGLKPYNVARTRDCPARFYRPYKGLKQSPLKPAFLCYHVCFYRPYKGLKRQLFFISCHANTDCFYRPYKGLKRTQNKKSLIAILTFLSSL